MPLRWSALAGRSYLACGVRAGVALDFLTFLLARLSPSGGGDGPPWSLRGNGALMCPSAWVRVGDRRVDGPRVSCALLACVDSRDTGALFRVAHAAGFALTAVVSPPG